MIVRTTQKVLLVGWAVGMVAVFSLVVFFHAMIARQQENVRETRKAVYDAEVELQKKQVTESQVLQLEDDVRLLRTGLADRENPLPLVRSVEDMQKLLPISVKVHDVREEGGVYSMRIVVEGEYDAVYGALQLIETSPSLLEEQSVVLEQITAEGAWRLSVHVRAPILYRGE